MGRILSIAGVVGIVVILVLLFLSSESPASAGGRFMLALQAQDANTLADVSYIQGKTRPELLTQWQDSLKYSKYYKFKYAIQGGETTRPDQANVRMTMQRNLGPYSYDENFTLPLVKVDNHWKVDLGAIARGIYPWMPR